MSRQGWAAISLIKDLLSKSFQSVKMNEKDPWILYADANTIAIGDRETSNLRFTYPIMGIIDLELYAFVYCDKTLAPSSLANFLPVPIGWSERTILSEFQCANSNTSLGDQSVDADGLTQENL